MSPIEFPLPARFARPGELPPTASVEMPVAVLDLAFAAGDPLRDVAWARSLGGGLAVWVDHHEQDCWAALRDDARFHLVPRSEAPACPPLVTTELVERYGPVRSLLVHGDLDGVLSAAKWGLLQDGLPVPAWLDPDSIAADTRVGSLTARGERLDRALRAGGSGRRSRLDILASVYAEGQGRSEPYALAERLDRLAAQHRRMCEASRRVADQALLLDDVDEDAVLVDTRTLPPDRRIDLTELMLHLQARHDWVIVIARGRAGAEKIVVSTRPQRSGLDLRQEFDLQGFAPFRVHVSPAQLLARLASDRLRRAVVR